VTALDRILAPTAPDRMLQLHTASASTTCAAAERRGFRTPAPVPPAGPGAAGGNPSWWLKPGFKNPCLDTTGSADCHDGRAGRGGGAQGPGGEVGWGESDSESRGSVPDEPVSAAESDTGDGGRGSYRLGPSP
jgi:hypothetical protein